MKKLIVALFAAILTTAGLVAVSSAPAAAGCSKSDYTCIPTKPVTGDKVVKQGKPAKIKVDVKVKGAAGNVKASGKVTITIKGPGGFTRTIKASYDGKTLKFKLGKLKRAGIYKVTIKFKGAKGFENSVAKSEIAVKKKKR